MTLIPIIPESAPFSAEQRAWLNGFLAGMLSHETVGNSLGNNIPSVASAAATTAEVPPQTAPLAEEDHPWHDPGIELNDRLEMAKDKPMRLQLMSAMAQLDCGQCGYVCQTYAEAIASGSEPKLTLCAPGGKETTKAIKSLLSDAPVTTDGTKAATVHSEKGQESGYNRNNPFAAKLLVNRLLSGESSQKETRQFVLDLGGSGMNYEVGDSLGVYATNCPDAVTRVIEAFGPELHQDTYDLLASILIEKDINNPSDDALLLLAEVATNSREAQQLRQLVESGDNTNTLCELLFYYPSARPEPLKLAESLATLAPRLYSISSSLKAHPEQVHLTVSVVRYEREGRICKGVASTFLAERAAERDVPVFIQQSHGFRLPSEGSTPVIMVGPGTGIAPFIAFLQERAAMKTPGPNWLFFGDQRRESDFLYERELASFQQQGVLSRLDTAFSRDQAEKIYVQNRMLDNGAELWNWLNAGAHFYVCGDAKRMAKDVDNALFEIVKTHGTMTEQSAKEYLAEMKKAKRYLRDVY